MNPIAASISGLARMATGMRRQAGASKPGFHQQTVELMTAPAASMMAPMMAACTSSVAPTPAPAIIAAAIWPQTTGWIRFMSILPDCALGRVRRDPGRGPEEYDSDRHDAAARGGAGVGFGAD